MMTQPFIKTLLILTVLSGCVSSSSTSFVSSSLSTFTNTTSLTSVTTSSSSVKPSSSSTLSRLEAPANIRITDSLLEWDPVVGTTVYEITINNEPKLFVTQPALSLADFDYGPMTLTILASDGKKLTSSTSVNLLYQPPTIETPTNITILDGLLAWDAIDYATGYEVQLNDQKQTVTSSSLDISQLPINTIYEITIQTLFYDLSSSPSNLLRYDANFETLGIMTYTQNKNTTDPSVIDISSYTTHLLEVRIHENPTPIATELLSFNAQGLLTLTTALIESLPYGLQILDVYSSDGIVQIQITVTDDRIPKLISLNEVKLAVGSPAVFTFNLWGGTLLEVSGNGITSEDYEINESQITISSSFIDFIFARDADRTVLILAYSGESHNQENIVIGYFFISRP